MTSFHCKLNDWSASGNFNKLINKVLERQDSHPISSKDSVPVSTAIETFIKNNQWRIEQSDLPALEKLQVLIRSFENQSKQKKNLKPTTLKKTIDAAIKLSRDPLKRQDPLKSFHSDASSLVHAYCSMDDNINLCIVRKDPSAFKTVPGSIDTATVDDMDRFVKNVYCKYKSDPDVSKDMIGLFFQHASEKQQHHFFNTVKNFCNLTFHSKGGRDQVNLSHFVSHMISAISSLPSLQTLNLSEFNLITDKDIEIIAGSPYMTSLRTLILNFCNKLTDESAKAIASSDSIRLHSLHFVGCPELTNQGVKEIAASSHMADLQTLILSRCRSLTDKAVATIARSHYMNNLQTLALSFCNKLTNEGIKAIASSPHMINLKTLRLQYCIQLTDKAAKAIADSRHIFLHSLCFSNCSEITNEGVKAIAKSPRMKDLQTLQMSNCLKLTDEAARAIADSEYIRLSNLHIDGCQGITNTGVKAIAACPQMKDLQTLVLSYCAITDEALKALAESKYIRLRYLDFSSCKITDNGAKTIAESPNMGDLQTLILNYCNHLTNEGIKAIINSVHLVNLVIVKLIACHATQETISLVNARLEQNKRSKTSKQSLEEKQEVF